MAREGDRAPEPSLGLLDVTMAGVGAMIGAGIFVLTGLAAHSTVNEVIQISGGGVRTIEEFSESLELLEIEVTPNVPAAGKQSSEIGFRRGSLIIQRDGEWALASGDTVLEPGARYLVATSPDAASELIRLLRG